MGVCKFSAPHKMYTYTIHISLGREFNMNAMNTTVDDTNFGLVSPSDNTFPTKISPCNAFAFRRIKRNERHTQNTIAHTYLLIMIIYNELFALQALASMGKSFRTRRWPDGVSNQRTLPATPTNISSEINARDLAAWLRRSTVGRGRVLYACTPFSMNEE